MSIGPIRKVSGEDGPVAINQVSLTLTKNGLLWVKNSLSGGPKIVPLTASKQTSSHIVLRYA